jgi:hypothetical protein
MPENKLDMAISWLKSRGFKEVRFTKGFYSHTSYYKDYPIFFKIEKREGYRSFVKESLQGGLLVFEISWNNNLLNHTAFSPILLFGLFNLKRKFKEKPLPWAKYLSDGFLLEKEFVKRFS